MAYKFTPVLKIADPDMNFNWWGRLKTRAWNLILPPHIRLEIPPKSDTQSKEEQK